MHEKQTCPSCGTRPAEWSEAAGGRRDAYEPVLDRCPGCEQAAYFRDTVDEKTTGKGTFVRLRPRT